MRKLVHRLVHNLDLKVVALLLAVLTWHYLATSGLEQRRFRQVGCRLLNKPQDVAVLSPGVPPADLVLEGPRGQLDTLEDRQLTVEIDLGHVSVEPGEPVTTSVRLLASNIRVAGEGERTKPLPPGIRFVSAEPDAFALTLESVTERELPVEPVVRGAPAPGYALHTQVQPPSVPVRGPFRLLQNLTSIRTEPIAVDGLRERLRQTVRLETQVPTKDGPVTLSPARRVVDVVLEATEKPEEKTFEHVPIRLAGVPEDVAILRQESQPREATVTLRGPRRRIEAIDARSLVVEANLAGEPPPETGTRSRAVQFLKKNLRQVAGPDTVVPLPPEVELAQVEPNTVQLLLDRVVTRELPVELELEGRPPKDHEVQATALPEKVAVEGPKTILDQLESLPTEPVLVTGLTERLRRRVRLATTADAGEFRNVPIRPDPPVVDVVLAVSERRVRKTLTELPVRLLLTPRPGLPMSVDLEPRVVGPVVFEGPRSHIENLTPESVLAYVRLDAAALTDPRPTICNVEFHIADPEIRLAPDTKPLSVRVDVTVPEAERRPEAPATPPPDAAPRPAPPEGAGPGPPSEE